MYERARRFLKREDGSATVEAVLWFPFFIAMFTLVVDASMIFHNQTYVTRVIQDGNRAMSTGYLDSTSDTETFIANRLAGLSESARVATSLRDGVIHTEVSVPAGDLDVIGWFGGLKGFDPVMTAEHYYEL